uniref:Uncharacterized protein n=1 Tax=Sphaerodactylus townsendi TaxID=933632 RepID=A0ACB8GBN7_9SAUR
MSQELNLNFLKGLEQEIILDVLYRDQILRKLDDERIRKLKMQLQQLRWKESRSSSHEYPKKSCARCQKALGMLINRGAVCNGCSHQVCSGCRIILNPYIWKCTVCYAHEDIKAKAGEWFFEERAKKFPAEDRHETAGTKLLKSYQKLSNISVVPPTPPPFSESTSGVNTVEHDQKKSFHRSVENLFLSFTTHMKNISKSQNDLVVDKCFLTADYGQEMELRKEKRSQSDTAIEMATRVKQAPSLQRLISGVQEDSGIIPEKDSIQTVLSCSPLRGIFSAGIRGSLWSLNSTCSEAGTFEKADVSGEIGFAIRYIFKSSILEICIKACKNLAYGEERKKKCNPYVKTYLLPDKSPQSKRKTSVKKNTVDPAFHETLKLQLSVQYKIEYSQLEMRELQVSVWHSGTFRRRVFLGEVVISFKSWDFEDKSAQLCSWYQLKAKPEKSEDNMIHYNGELLVRAKLVSPSLYNNSEYEDQMKGREGKAYPDYQLHLMILEARNLPVIRTNGVLNPFVKRTKLPGLQGPDLAQDYGGRERSLKSVLVAALSQMEYVGAHVGISAKTKEEMKDTS